MLPYNFHTAAEYAIHHRPSSGGDSRSHFTHGGDGRPLPIVTNPRLPGGAYFLFFFVDLFICDTFIPSLGLHLSAQEFQPPL